MSFREAFDAAAKDSFRKLVEETKMLKSYLVFGDGNGGVLKCSMMSWMSIWPGKIRLKLKQTY